MEQTKRKRNYKTPLNREKSKRFRRNNPNYMKEWREKNREYYKNYRQRGEVKLKNAARQILNFSIHKGLVVRPKNCSKCLKKLCVIEAHHEDYTKPLEILWLCIPCHLDVHL